jgi:hypothetical protein
MRKAHVEVTIALENTFSLSRPVPGRRLHLDNPVASIRDNSRSAASRRGLANLDRAELTRKRTGVSSSTV